MYECLFIQIEVLSGMSFNQVRSTSYEVRQGNYLEKSKEDIYRRYFRTSF